MIKDYDPSHILKHVEPYEHVIWDWNGTLLDDVDVAVDSIGALLEESKLEKIGTEKYREVFGFPVKNYYERIGFDFRFISFDELSNRFIHHYEKRVKTATLFPNTAFILAQIAETKTQSILSAAFQNHLEEITGHFGIGDYFDFVFGLGNYYADSKVARGKELITMSGICPSKTIIIGDTDHDIDVAKELGTEILLIADGHQSYDRLRTLHPKVLSSRYQGGSECQA